MALAAGAMAVTVAASGCIRSKVVVTSDPPGADVSMNDVHLGRTPVESPFLWYWYYDFKAEKEGYRTGAIRERFDAPVYLWMGPDLVMELLPIPVIDRRKVHFDLEPDTRIPEPEYVTTGEEPI